MVQMCVILNNNKANMKTVIVLSIFLAVTLASRRDEVREAVVACGGEIDGPNDLRKQVLVENADIPALGKIMFCVNKKTGLQKENGDIDSSILRRDIEHFIHDKTKVDALVEECGKRKGTTPEEAAFNYLKCYVTKVAAKTN